MQNINFKLKNRRKTRKFNFCTLHFPFWDAAVVLALLVSLWNPPAASAAPAGDLEEQTRLIAAELRCPVCQNLSVGDSPSELAQQMRAVIQEQLKEGKSPEEIRGFFVSKYGDWVLLAPPARGLNLLLWILPFAAVALGGLLAALLMRRWVKKKGRLREAAVEPSLVERVRREAAAVGAAETEEQTRLYTELRELDFDFQAGRLSKTDYHDLRRELETQTALALKQLEAAREKPRARAAAAQTPPREKERPTAETRSLRNWQLAAGGAFLLLFGLTLGALLTRSVRPRGSEQETMTGDFLTGTQPSRESDLLLAQGRAAFQQRDWPQAIDAFKKVLAAEPDNSEAHAYMGLILAQAGHAEGALMAFDRALAADSNLPLALWGRGMLLYRTHKDLAGAQESLQKLVSIMPPSAEKTEVEKILAEIAQAGGGKKILESTAPAANAQLQGVVDVDPKLKGRVDNQAVLFIIARSANSAAGPPLAVKKIARPVFPVTYSLGPDDLMLPGASFSGKVYLSARLDKDGNPTTREPGNLTGEYKKNPVEVGSQKIDILLDQVM